MYSLGLERAGFTTVAFCEIDPYCRKILARHWPDVPVWGDVRTLTVDDGWLVPDADERCEPAQEQLRAGRQGIRADSIDVICGGFPCQDISTAGKGAGITGSRSGLWKEYARIIGEVRPRYAIIENVAALLHRGLADVLFDLSALGYDAEWHCIPASAVGAPHRRDRVWIVAYPQHPDADGAGPHRAPQHVDGDTEFRDQQVGVAGSVCEDVADAAWLQPGRQEQRPQRQRTGQSGQSVDVADAAGGIRQREAQRQAGHAAFGREDVADANDRRRQSGRECEEKRDNFKPVASRKIRLCERLAGQLRHDNGTYWLVEPDVGRVAHGVPARVDRLRSLGNAVVPQIPEIIGRAILASEAAR